MTPIGRSRYAAAVTLPVSPSDCIAFSSLPLWCIVCVSGAETSPSRIPWGSHGDPHERHPHPDTPRSHRLSCTGQWYQVSPLRPRASLWGRSRGRRHLPYLRRGLSRYASPLGTAAACDAGHRDVPYLGLGGPPSTGRSVWRPGPAVPLVWQSPLSQVPNPGHVALGGGALRRAIRYSLFPLCPNAATRTQSLGPRQPPAALRPPLREC